MSWFFRPSLLIVASVVLALSAAMLVFWPQTIENQAIPLPILEGDQEIVWLYSATSGAQWERFVSAIELAVRRLRTGPAPIEVDMDKEAAFPPQTTAIPEVSLSPAGATSHLRFRWYKLTSELKAQDWVRALLKRRPMPLAIIGGNSSDQAIGLAHALQDEGASPLREAGPLLLLTTATADDEVDQSSNSAVALTSIYADRTFRFCFTNRQMAAAMVDFIWSRDDLRPDSEPVYLAYWADDPYSNDLSTRFLEALNIPEARVAGQDWAALTAFLVAGGFPLDFGGTGRRPFASAGIPISERIEYSVGSSDRPNRWEAQAADNLLKAKLTDYPTQARPLLLITPAASQSAHRFLRALARSAPSEARRFVVATGDGIPFNAVYRDRDVAWPIQDLPFSLLFFCHRNPVDASAGFVPENPQGSESGTPTAPSPGTEDLLLNLDIVAAVTQAALKQHARTVDPTEFRQRMRETRWSVEHGLVGDETAAVPLFDADGNRRSATGEHIVYLRPASSGPQIEAKGIIEVWAWQAGMRESGPAYQRQARLEVPYDVR
jgi:hypothetical protein